MKDHIRLTQWAFDALMRDLHTLGYSNLAPEQRAICDAIDDNRYTVIAPIGQH